MRLQKQKPYQAKYLKKKSLNFSKCMVCAMGLFIVIFVVAEFVTFWITDNHQYPYELAAPVLALCGAEYGWLSSIKNTDTKHRQNEVEQIPDDYDGC